MHHYAGKKIMENLFVLFITIIFHQQFAVSPVFTHLNPKLQIYFHIQLLLNFLSGIGSDFL